MNRIYGPDMTDTIGRQASRLFLPALICLATLVMSSITEVPAQEAEAAPNSTDSAENEISATTQSDTKEDAEGNAMASADGSQAAGRTNDYEKLKNNPEFQADLAELRTEFEAARKELEDAILAQRSTHIRYVNQEENDKSDFDRYLEQRNLTRELMDITYNAALAISRMSPDEDAAQYVLTMVQHRVSQGIYNYGTYEGASRLLNGGLRFVFLFHAAARSAVIEGEFEDAKRLYDALEQDEIKDVDKRFIFTMEQMEQAYLKERDIRFAEAQQDNLPQVKLTTTQGDITIELFINQAPTAVANFIGLVEQGFYDGLDFYQVINDLLALTGDPTGLGNGNSGKFLMDEHQNEDSRPALRGSLVMAKIPEDESGKFIENSASCQFSILFVPLVSVQESQTVFGRVIEGMDVACRLRRVDPSKEKKKGEILLPPDRILEATVIRKPDELPEPEYVDVEALRQAAIEQMRQQSANSGL